MQRWKKPDMAVGQLLREEEGAEASRIKDVAVPACAVAQSPGS